MEKQITIDTDLKSGQVFRVNEYRGEFTVYRMEIGILFDDSTRIGETRSLDDAISLIKASVQGSVRSVKIKDW